MSDYQSKTPFGKNVYFANGGSNHHTASQNREMTEWQDREIQRLTDENDALRKSAQNAAFYRSCALSGEVPNDGDEPHPSQDKGSDEG